MTQRKLSQVLTREAFLSSVRSLKRERVEIEGLGTVYVRELTERQMIRYNEHLQRLKADGAEVNPEKGIYLAALVTSMSACDEEGTLLFSEEDVEQLADLPFQKLRAVAETAMRLSGVYEVADNLKKAFDSSTTDSPRSSASP